MTTDSRSVALEILRRVQKEKAFASSALRVAFSAHPDLSSADRGLITELVYGVLRRRGLLDRAIAQASGRRIKDIEPKLIDVLRMAAYQIIDLDRIPDHAAVDTAVRMAKRRRGQRGGAFVNAILRNLLRTPEDVRVPPPVPFAEDPAAHISQTASLPLHLARRLVEDLGAQTAEAFARASLDIAPLSLRANRLKTTQEALRDEVQGSLGALPWSVRLPPRAGILPTDLDCVRDGRATPQDEASMRVVELLDPQPTDRVLDLCAAPGGKTTHAAERMNGEGEVVAHDRLPARLARVRTSADRLGLTNITIAEALPEEAETFDRVLVDAPCSGLGTLRRHPEIRWRLTDRDIEELNRTQTHVLAQGAARVKPGGVLVYSVCTVTKAESDERIEGLEGFTLDEIVRTGPHQEGAPDGFFAARLVKQG